MLRSDFHKFGLGLETLISQHADHKSVEAIISQLSKDLRGKYRIIADIMKNAADQVAWEEILYLVGDQFDKIGRKLGQKNLSSTKIKGIADDFELAGDLFGQFADQNKVEFNYPSVQQKFVDWRADI